MITFAELCDKLKQLDETTLMEVLQLHSDELVERCKDREETSKEGKEVMPY